MLAKNILAGQESWEKKDSSVNVEWYKWFWKPRASQNCQRWKGSVGFLVHNCLVNEDRRKV